MPHQYYLLLSHPSSIPSPHHTTPPHTHTPPPASPHPIPHHTRSGGSDWRTVKVMEIDQESGEVSEREDVLDHVKFSGMTWTHDHKVGLPNTLHAPGADNPVATNIPPQPHPALTPLALISPPQPQGFFYCRYEPPKTGDAGTETDLNLNQQLAYHVVGRPQVRGGLGKEEGRPDRNAVLRVVAACSLGGQTGVVSWAGRGAAAACGSVQLSEGGRVPLLHSVPAAGMRRACAWLSVPQLVKPGSARQQPHSTPPSPSPPAPPPSLCQSEDVTVLAIPDNPEWMMGTEITHDGKCEADREGGMRWGGVGCG